MPIDIVVDAMGSDKAPEPEIRGAILAARQYDVRVHLVGPEDVLRPILRQHLRGQHLPVFIVPASEWITMDDKAAQAVRTKRDSTMRVGLKMVREGLASHAAGHHSQAHGHTRGPSGPGKASGFFTAGNTGAAMATAKMVLGMLSGVDRPALSGVFPTHKGTPVVVVDVGANVDCEPEMLKQFGLMGEVYSRSVLKIKKPRVGLLSIGEEEHKGNALTRDATPLLKSLGINFIGNVEGRDIFSGHVDVIVCDGFVGNVALKVSEGLSDMIRRMLRESLEATVTRKIGYALSRSAYTDFKKRIDYSEYGGAPLLGVKGVCIICHGRSDSNAIKNAIRVAADSASSNMNQRIEEELRDFAKV